jgi:hypothetical protein
MFKGRIITLIRYTYIFQKHKHTGMYVLILYVQTKIQI